MKLSVAMRACQGCAPHHGGRQAPYLPLGPEKRAAGDNVEKCSRLGTVQRGAIGVALGT